MKALEQLKKYSIVVVDTGEIGLIDQHRPRDATTNPSLLLKAVQKDPNSKKVIDALQYGRSKGETAVEQVRYAMDKLAVNVGKEILQLIPGRVSTEVPARLSYDAKGTYQYALELRDLYEEAEVDTQRVLFKIAATWEGIQAARKLESMGVNCNLTLLFSLEQAIACAEAGITLISPFVGRIYDWHSKNGSLPDPYTAEEDPGVQSVQEIYNYFKLHGHKTEIMGASFRTVDQVLALAGCDLITIAPDLLDQLGQMEQDVPRVLSSDNLTEMPTREINEINFRMALTLNPMAYEKLGEGIRRFDEDAKKLEGMLREKLESNRA